jgi:DNA-binding NtrC family response regulator
MRDVMALIARAATMRAGVLIRGEEGTGRQVTARAIHNAQAQARGPFVRVDCAAYEGDQLDVELFGVADRSSNPDHPTRGLEKVSRQSRLFEARHGTLYLQNVAEAPMRVQARLARLLRDREAVLVESGETISLDVRPMAGVDMGFDRAVHEGRVRDDLFRRLSVIRIEVPPLRNRRDDIAALANCFVRELCGSLRVPPKTLSRPALALIAALPWRGNATELRALLESIVTGVPGGRGIVLEDVLGHVRLDGGSVVYEHTGTLRQARARFEREYIAQVLERHRGRISDAAKALGIQRTNLYRKMRSLRVTRDQRTSQK